jgi:YjbE family integral membrane protein
MVAVALPIVYALRTVTALPARQAATAARATGQDAGARQRMAGAPPAGDEAPMGAEWFIALGQVLLIDLVLAGDNAIVVGMAAAGLPPDQRRKAIFWGIIAATVMRIGFAAITTQLLAIVGIALFGGLLLLWVCWKMFRELRQPHEQAEGAHAVAGTADAGSIDSGAPRKTMRQAIMQILIADVSMSLDNVLAVAGAAKEHLDVLVIGLGISVVLMGVAATFIAKLLERHRWIAWVGLLVILYVALEMIYSGSGDVIAWWNGEVRTPGGLPH